MFFFLFFFFCVISAHGYTQKLICMRFAGSKPFIVSAMQPAIFFVPNICCLVAELVGEIVGGGKECKFSGAGIRELSKFSLCAVAA